MVTPTCNTCKTKFPGKDVCVKCGADPNGKPVTSIQVRISTDKYLEGMRKLAKSFNDLSAALRPHAREFSKYERRQIKAHLRSVHNQTPHRPHGHPRGR